MAGLASRQSVDAAKRLAELAIIWRVTVDRTVETAASILAFGWRGADPVVVKVTRRLSAQDTFGRVLEEFDGHGTVRLYAHVPGAALLEHLRPGTPLVTLCHRGEDAAATDVLAEVIGAMQAPRARVEGFPEVAQWGQSLQSYLQDEDGPIPKHLVEEAFDHYALLCASQIRARLLHGDLHHNNVLWDSGRGWLAIDPKGVVGELAYELGAVLRNPYESPDQFAVPSVIERRVQTFASRLGADPARTLRWAFAQAVLAAVWEAEDGSGVGTDNPFLRLAASLRPMLG